MFNAPADAALVRVPDLSNTDSYYGQRITYLATAAETGSHFLLLDATERQGLELPAHMHEHEDETVVLLEGAATFWVGDQTFEVGPGDIVFMPRGVPHRHRVDSDELHALLLVTPGAMEGYYRALIRQAEGNGAEIDLGKVQRIGGAYGIEFVDGMNGHQNAPKSPAAPVHRRRDEGDLLNLVGNPTRLKLAAADTAKAFSLFVTEDVLHFGPPLHLHHNDHESFVVLEGEYLIRIGEETHQAKAGAFVHIPKETPHTYARISESPAQLLVLTTPGGFEKFCREVDAMPAPADGKPDTAALDAIAGKYGIDIIGPPIAFP
jgi:quercetin dioxygenase-like cupin family protein